jgi:hypothetical protein
VALGGTGELASPGGGADRPVPVRADLLVTVVDEATVRGGKSLLAGRECVVLRLRVKYRNGSVADVTDDANTQFGVNPGTGRFTAKNIWSPQPGDARRAVTVYGQYSTASAGSRKLIGKATVRVRAPATARN